MLHGILQHGFGGIGKVVLYILLQAMTLKNTIFFWSAFKITVACTGTLNKCSSGHMFKNKTKTDLHIPA